MCPNCMMNLGMALGGAAAPSLLLGASLVAALGLRSTSTPSHRRVAKTDTEETAT
jgi:hypothetical protein